MRWFHITVIVLLIAALLIFSVQNLQSVTVAFLNFRIGAPLAALVVLTYVLGMITGGSVLALIRWALEGSKKSGAA